MKQQNLGIEKAAKQIVKHITEQELYGWPPLCPALCYQPVRPKKGKRPIITRPEQVAAGSHLWDPAVRLFPYMLPVPYHWMPGHQSLQLFMRRGFAQLGQQAQYQQKVFVWINAVGLGCFYQ